MQGINSILETTEETVEGLYAQATMIAVTYFGKCEIQLTLENEKISEV